MYFILLIICHRMCFIKHVMLNDAWPGCCSQASFASKILQQEQCRLKKADTMTYDEHNKVHLNTCEYRITACRKCGHLRFLKAFWDIKFGRHFKAFFEGPSKHLKAFQSVFLTELGICGLKKIFFFSTAPVFVVVCCVFVLCLL